MGHVGKPNKQQKRLPYWQSSSFIHIWRVPLQPWPIRDKMVSAHDKQVTTNCKTFNEATEGLFLPLVQL